eukprot:923575-Prymnesium_polylepis.1
MMLPVALRNFLHDYIRARDTATAHTVLRMEPASPNLDLSSPGRQSSTACLPNHPQPSSVARSASKKHSRGPGAALSETATRR